MTQRRLEGRIAVVFGAGSVGPGWGNGKATAVQYAREGASVIAVDINPAAARETCEIILSEGNEASAEVCDVIDPDQIHELFSRVEARSGRVDILHNNVGAASVGAFSTFEDSQWELDMNINARSVFYTCRRALPGMLEQGRGVIINVSSIASVRYTGYPYPAYSAGKAAVNQLTVSIALEHANRGIRANVIMPGLMDTPTTYQLRTQYSSEEEMRQQRAAICPMGRMGTGWDIAFASAFLASDDAQYITGACLPVDGGITCRV